MPPHATAYPPEREVDQPSPPPWDVADIFRLHGETYRRAPPVPPAPQKVMRDIEACRTAPLGGHAEHCPPCGFERYASHACRNRHGPKCQTCTKGQWVEDRKAAWLPVPSFHLVLTVPHALTPLILAHKRPLLTLLYNAASQTLGQCGHRNLGGQIGCPMVWHPWEQTLGAHGHVHCVIAAGALSSKGEHWIDADPRVLLPVRALSTVFRGKFCTALAQAGATDAVPLPEALHSCAISSMPKSGSSTPRPPVPALHTSWTLSAALRLASPSRTTGSSTCETEGAALPPATGVRAIVAKQCRLTPTNLSAAACCRCCPAASSGSDIMASWPIGPRRAPCAAVGNCCQADKPTRPGKRHASPLQQRAAAPPAQAHDQSRTSHHRPQHSPQMCRGTVLPKRA